MSIVGTRPPTLDEWNKYELHHRARLAIKPGIDAIPQRTRFYHAIIDRRCLKSGQSYDRLKKVFVIFICPYDPFGDADFIHPSETAYDKAIRRMEEREAYILNSSTMQMAASAAEQIRKQQASVIQTLKPLQDAIQPYHSMTEETRARVFEK